MGEESREERLCRFVKNNYKCSHTHFGRSIVEKGGWCPRCGCARDDYALSIKAGDKIISALNGYIFEHNDKRIWFKQALCKLGLFDSEWEMWQPVEEAEKEK